MYDMYSNDVFKFPVTFVLVGLLSSDTAGVLSSIWLFTAAHFRCLADFLELDQKTRPGNIFFATSNSKSYRDVRPICYNIQFLIQLTIIIIRLSDFKPD